MFKVVGVGVGVWVVFDVCQQHGLQQVGVHSTVTVHFKDVLVFSLL